MMARESAYTAMSSFVFTRELAGAVEGQKALQWTHVHAFHR